MIKKVMLAIVIYLFTGNIVMAGVTGLDSAVYHTKSADRYASHQQYAKALKEYNAAISKDKESFDAWLGKAKAELALAQFKSLSDTLNELDDLAKSKTQKFEYILTNGQYLLAAKPKGWFRRLKENFFKAKKINPEDSDLQLMVARAYQANGKEASARKHYSKVIEIGGANAAVATKELASIFRQLEASGTGKGWVGELAGKATISRAMLAAVLANDIEVQHIFPKRSHHIALPADSKNNTFSAAIDTIVNTQLTSITVDGRGLFNPDASVTRFELAKLVEEILVAYTGKKELTRAFIGTKSPFPDLKSSHYAFNAAFLAISRGLMIPEDLVNGNFAGDKPVSGADLLLVLRKLGSIHRAL